MIETKTTSVLTVTIIAGAILVIGTSIGMAFADPNLLAPGQSGANPGQSGALPPGHQPGSFVSPPGNPGQCMKAGFTDAYCFAK